MSTSTRSARRRSTAARRGNCSEIGGGALLHVGRLELLERASRRQAAGPRPSATGSVPLLEDVHLEQDRVEAAAVDDLALERLLHALDADEAVANEEGAQREGIASCPDHVGPGDPVVQAALLAVEADPQKAQRQQHQRRQIRDRAHQRPPSSTAARHRRR